MTYEYFSGFLSAMLHEDWPDEYDDASGAAADYAAQSPVEHVQGALEDLQQLIATDMPDSELMTWIEEAGSYYIPDAPARDWLTELHAVMARTLAEREAEGSSE